MEKTISKIVGTVIGVILMAVAIGGVVVFAGVLLFGVALVIGVILLLGFIFCIADSLMNGKPPEKPKEKPSENQDKKV